VTAKGKVLPKDVIECWPEVFGEVRLHVLPLRYLHSVIVNFKDGKVWEIKVTAQTKSNGWESFEHSLSELFRSYEKRIDNIDFKLDSVRVKKDIEQRTKRFLRKKKL
jgi:hypothetical protein